MSDDVSVIPMMGGSPHTHMGHRYDLGEKLASLPGKKIVGISALPGVLPMLVRSDILARQWRGIDCQFVVVGSAGMTLHLARQHGTNLNILVGHDRLKKFGEGLTRSLEQNKIKEMGGLMFKSIRLHTPDGDERTHGLSGTRMRQAIADDDYSTYIQHYGKNEADAEFLWKHCLRPAHQRGEIIIKRR